MTRAEHMKWAKDRALEILDGGGDLKTDAKMRDFIEGFN